jgi:hypothetical protein
MSLQIVKKSGDTLYLIKNRSIFVNYSLPLDNDSLKLSLFSFPASWPEKKNQAA